MAWGIRVCLVGQSDPGLQPSSPHGTPPKSLISKRPSPHLSSGPNPESSCEGHRALLCGPRDPKCPQMALPSHPRTVCRFLRCCQSTDDFFMFSVLPAPDSPLQVQSRSRQVKSREGSGCREAKQCKVQAGRLHIPAIRADRVGPEGTWALKPLTPTQLSRCSLTLLGPLVCSLQISIQSPPN